MLMQEVYIKQRGKYSSDAIVYRRIEKLDFVLKQPAQHVLAEYFVSLYNNNVMHVGTLNH